MKHGRLFYIAPMVWVLLAALLLSCVAMWFLEPIVAYIQLAIVVLLTVITVVRFVRKQRDIDRYMRRVLKHINETDEQSLSTMPLSIAVVTEEGQILWHNSMFSMNVIDHTSMIGKFADSVLPLDDYHALNQIDCVEADVGNRHFRVYVSPLSVRGQNMFVLYYTDITELYLDSLEYAATRPIVMLIQIDNLDELVQKLRESERSRIESVVENALEDWLSKTTAVLKKIDDDRYFAVVEKRYLDAMVQARFDILDRVRAVPVECNAQITLSIGIGEAEEFQSAEKAARLALDMALGRGGDQAALHTPNGFEFYGGHSKGVEKRTKVRTRIMASALHDLIMSSDNVLVMGHRYSDLDSVGSSAALTSVCRMLGKPTHVVASRSTTLADELFVRYEQAGKGDYFVEPSDALMMIRSKTLLIITDTHVPQLLESLPVYERSEMVAVIDHHRKAAVHCDKAVLFHHESYASSACEMVAELVQYLDIPDLSAVDAEALLAGIMLDTRNFVLNAGVRTFEAAAYLRKLGADTVSVKKIFSGSMDVYREKNDVVSNVQFYENTAIACATQGNGASLRIACAQAADELLTIKNVDAAFALFVDGTCVNISARSYGAYNVQLIMEYLGGGGHLTMAGAQLKGISLQEAVKELEKAIDRYLTENSSKT